jgi:RNA polymerase sigma-70 factor, ECF subfamily
MSATITFGSSADTMTTEPTLSFVPSTFDEFFETEYPGLVAVASALSGSKEDGEDLVQDTMVKALLRWGQVRRYERPGGWAHRVLVNACRGWWRRRRSETRYLASLRRAEPTVAGPSADVIAFWAAVRTLPERPRMAMVLHYAGDRTSAEVASILGVPEGTVRSDLTRARTALARLLS